MQTSRMVEMGLFRPELFEQCDSLVRASSGVTDRS